MAEELRPMRICPNCKNTTSLKRCGGSDCNNRKTVPIYDKEK
jgi:hypothetical protein